MAGAGTPDHRADRRVAVARRAHRAQAGRPPGGGELRLAVAPQIRRQPGAPGAAAGTLRVSEVEYQPPLREEGRTPGALLREAREAAGMSVLDVSHALKLTPRQIEAIESDDYERLSGPTFVRGFIRNYARLLRLDAAPLIAELDERAQTPTELRVPVNENVRMPSGVEKPTRRWTTAAVLALILLGAAIVLYFDVVDVAGLMRFAANPPQREGTPVAAPAVSPPATSVIAPPPAATPAPPPAVPMPG